MKVTKCETFLTNAGLRNYLFVRLSADNGLAGLGEASLEWQERTVETLIHEWVEDRVLGADPADLQSVIDAMIRGQYQGSATVMTVISGVEIALWDLLGKAQEKQVCELLGGRAREHLPAYANGWYGTAVHPAQYAAKARDVVACGYTACATMSSLVNGCGSLTRSPSSTRSRPGMRTISPLLWEVTQ